MAKKKNPVGFSAKTFRHTTVNLGIKQEVMKAYKSSPEIRGEIRKVFQRANRRIQNIERAGIVSPSVMALNKGNIKGFSKFSMHSDWDTLKREYAKAVSFLQQPTSSATGAREYGKHLKNAYNLTDNEFNLMQNNLLDKINSISDQKFLEQYLMKYKDFSGELEESAASLAEQIESDAKRLGNALNNQETQMENTLDSIEQSIVDMLDDFGI